jgi:hypothetical protein
LLTNCFAFAELFCALTALKQSVSNKKGKIFFMKIFLKDDGLKPSRFLKSVRFYEV